MSSTSGPSGNTQFPGFQQVETPRGGTVLVRTGDITRSVSTGSAPSEQLIPYQQGRDYVPQFTGFSNALTDLRTNPGDSIDSAVRWVANVPKNAEAQTVAYKLGGKVAGFLIGADPTTASSREVLVALISKGACVILFQGIGYIAIDPTMFVARAGLLGTTARDAALYIAKSLMNNTPIISWLCKVGAENPNTAGWLTSKVIDGMVAIGDGIQYSYNYFTGNTNAEAPTQTLDQSLEHGVAVMLPQTPDGFIHTAIITPTPAGEEPLITILSQEVNSPTNSDGGQVEELGDENGNTDEKDLIPDDSDIDLGFGKPQTWNEYFNDIFRSLNFKK